MQERKITARLLEAEKFRLFGCPECIGTERCNHCMAAFASREVFRDRIKRDDERTD
jgi:hypothetical protein